MIHFDPSPLDFTHAYIPASMSSCHDEKVSLMPKIIRTSDTDQTFTYANVLEQIDITRLSDRTKRSDDDTYPMSGRGGYVGRTMKSIARNLKISTGGTKKELYERITKRIAALKMAGN